MGRKKSPAGLSRADLVAVVHVFKGCIDDVLVYKDSNRRRGIASALYRLIEVELGRPLVPSRIRSKSGKAFWATRR